MRVLPGDNLVLTVESRRFGCEGGDTRFAGPAQASWSEVQRGGRSSFGPEACGGVIRTERREA